MKCQSFSEGLGDRSQLRESPTRDCETRQVWDWPFKTVAKPARGDSGLYKESCTSRNYKDYRKASSPRVSSALLSLENYSKAVFWSRDKKIMNSIEKLWLFFCSFWSVPLQIGVWIHVKEITWQIFARTCFIGDDKNNYSSISCLFSEEHRGKWQGKSWTMRGTWSWIPCWHFWRFLLSIAATFSHTWPLLFFLLIPIRFFHKFPCFMLMLLQFKSRGRKFLFLVPAYKMLFRDMSFCPKWSSRKRIWQQIKP